MKSKKASGVDEVTKELYDNNLLENIDDLIARMKRQAYKSQPVYEDKLVVGEVSIFFIMKSQIKIIT